MKTHFFYLNKYSNMEGASEVTGSTSSNKPKINTKEWLKKHKLTDIEKVFVDRDVSIEELTEFSDEDLRYTFLLFFFFHFCA